MSDTSSVGSLLTAEAVRTRSRMIFDAGQRNELTHFALRLDALPACATYVAETIRQNYPDLKVPPHSRWRHLDANGPTELTDPGRPSAGTGARS